jgi:hypothetical protein
MKLNIFTLAAIAASNVMSSEDVHCLDAPKAEVSARVYAIFNSAKCCDGAFVFHTAAGEERRVDKNDVFKDVLFSTQSLPPKGCVEGSLHFPRVISCFDASDLAVALHMAALHRAGSIPLLRFNKTSYQIDKILEILEPAHILISSEAADLLVQLVGYCNYTLCDKEAVNGALVARINAIKL